MSLISKSSSLKIVSELCSSYKDGIDRFLSNITDDFNLAVKLILETKGHVVVSGMGKSGHVDEILKIAAKVCTNSQIQVQNCVDFKKML